MLCLTRMSYRVNVISDLDTCGTRWMLCSTLDRRCTKWISYVEPRHTWYKANVMSDLDTCGTSECYVWHRHVWYKWMLCLTQTRVVQGECYVRPRHVRYKVNVMSDTDTGGTRWMLCLTQTRVVQGECYVWHRYVWHKVNVVPDLDTCGRTRWMLCLTWTKNIGKGLRGAGAQWPAQDGVVSRDTCNMQKLYLADMKTTPSFALRT